MHTPANVEAVNYVQLHPKDAIEHPIQFPVYIEPFRPFTVASRPVQS